MGNDTLSNQEIHIISKKSGILICRYYIKTRVLERLFDAPEQRFGVPALQENMPESAVAAGAVSDGTRQAYLAFYADAVRGVPSGEMEAEMRMSSGEFRWHHAEYSLVYEDNGETAYALILVHDNTKMREMELVKKKWQASVSSVIADAVLYCEINLTSNTVERLDGNALERLDTKSLTTMQDLISLGALGHMDASELVEYKAFLNRRRLLGLFEEGVYEDAFDYCVKRPDNELDWLRATVVMITYPGSDAVMAIVSIVRLDAQQRELEQLSHKAFHDALTGLLNREAIGLRTAELLAQYDPKASTALFMIDLDNFKQINDRLGHQAGDLVLKQVADALRASFHEDDVVGRLGGDEFIVMLSGKIHPQFLEKKALELIAATNLTYGDKKGVPISISIGIAYGQGRFAFEKLYQIADVALYAAKKAGKCCFHLINADTNEAETCAAAELPAAQVSLQSLLRHMEEAESKTPYEALVENIPGGMLVIELRKDVRVIHCNDWLCRFTGYTKQEMDALQEKTPFALLLQNDLPALEKAVQAVREGKNTVSMTYRVQLKDGGYRHVALNATVTQRSKEMIVLHGIQTDVDALLTVQKELEASRRKLQAIFNALPGGVAVLEIGKDAQADLKHLGDWIYEYCGFSKDEIVQGEHNHFGTVWHEDMPAVHTAVRAVRDGDDDVFDITVRVRHKTGEPKHVNMRGSVIERREDKTVLYTIFTAASQQE